MNKENKSNTLVRITIVGLFVALCAFGVPSVYALFNAQTNSAENKFTTGNVNVAVMEKGSEHEDFSNNIEEYQALRNANDTVDKVVNIKNKANPAYVRVILEASVVSDTDANAVLLEGVEVEYTFAKKTAWKVDANGIYYYTKVLEEGSTSEVLLEKVMIKQDIPTGYHLEVKVLSDAISAGSLNNLKEAWGIENFNSLKSIN